MSIEMKTEDRSAAEATARPWWADGQAVCGPGGFQQEVAVCTDDEDVEGDPWANAELIVRAVNSHEALVEALRKLRNAAVNTPALDDSDEWTALVEEADAALDAARGA